MLKLLKQYPPAVLELLNGIVIVGSVLLCALLMPLRFPFLELMNIGPNWLLIWVVVWSVKRTALQGALAGILLGWIQDGLTAIHPTHAIALGIVGMLTARLQKPKFIVEDFISVALIVFAMVLVSETIFAIQLSWQGDRDLEHIWSYYRQVALSSAILSSLWAPVIYYPLNLWWESLQACKDDKSITVVKKVI